MLVKASTAKIHVYVRHGGGRPCELLYSDSGQLCFRIIYSPLSGADLCIYWKYYKQLNHNSLTELHLCIYKASIGH